VGYDCQLVHGSPSRFCAGGVACAEQRVDFRRHEASSCVQAIERSAPEFGQALLKIPT
jgi:hypothetical protein